jgi:nitrogen fixation NifU-like protein
MMTDAIIGKTESEAETLFGSFHEMATAENDDFDASSLGKLSSLAGVKDYPMRVKCATLAWHTMDAAIKRANSDITTE